MADAQLFAAPTAAAHAPGGGGLLEVTLSLALVVACIALLAWFVRRMRRGAGGASGRIQVLADQSLGVKERCVLVRVGDTQILVGVAQGSVRALHVFAPGANTEPPPVADEPARLPNFRDLLMKSLGR